jgi:hypothetical protein
MRPGRAVEAGNFCERHRGVQHFAAGACAPVRARRGFQLRHVTQFAEHEADKGFRHLALISFDYFGAGRSYPHPSPPAERNRQHVYVTNYGDSWVFAGVARGNGRVELCRFFTFARAGALRRPTPATASGRQFDHSQRSSAPVPDRLFIFPSH